MRPVDNPPNRFERLCLEWEVEPPAAELQVFEDATRSILSENDSPDLGFRWSVNPYRGCGHACSYCYARPSHEFLGFGAGTDFETRLVVKTRAPELLRTALHRTSWRRELIAFSGDTDAWQPLEAHYGLTRRCLEVCRDAGNPVGIVTKSWLVTRDIDILGSMAAEGLVKVAMSIAFVDEEVARQIEPGAPRPNKRFEAIRRLADAGVPVDVSVAPIIPGLNDHELPEILERARDAGAKGATRVLLRLPGAVEQVFLERLRAELPLRAKRVEERIRDTRGGELNDGRYGHRMKGKGVYWDAIARTFDLARERLGLTRRFRPEAAPRGQGSLF